jgi:hypothetical protein
MVAHALHKHRLGVLLGPQLTHSRSLGGLLLLLLWSLLAWLLLNLLGRCMRLLLALLLWGLLALLLRDLQRGLAVLQLQVLRRCLLPPLHLRLLLLLPDCVAACCCLCW